MTTTAERSRTADRDYQVVDRYLRSIEKPPTPAGPALEAQFVSVAKRFSQRRGIGYLAWRDIGVPTSVLTRAGITQSF